MCMCVNTCVSVHVYFCICVKLERYGKMTNKMNSQWKVKINWTMANGHSYRCSHPIKNITDEMQMQR